ncbi:MAG TPA: hypothetical protein VL361_23940 [Candidatus Limnocylindrales bacterium]|nr:hypothetical protein [Candidatus Limnocylindrales bacterium]
MKMMLVFGLALLLPSVVRSSTTDDADASRPTTNLLVVPEGWLQLPSHELVLDIQQEFLEYDARQNAGEFLAAILNVLLGVNYAVRLSDEFLQGEIKYYRANLTREVPVEMSSSILTCLERARDSGVLDWDCFKQGFTRSAEMKTTERHLPWMAPPFRAKAVTLARVNGTNLACLHLSLKWAGRAYGGAVQYSRRPGSLPGERVMVEGQRKLWAFAAVMRLTRDGQTLFEKTYPREEWQKTYITIYDQPVWKTSQAILQDIATGLRFKPAPAAEPGKTKLRQHS